MECIATGLELLAMNHDVGRFGSPSDAPNGRKAGHKTVMAMGIPWSVDAHCGETANLIVFFFSGNMLTVIY